MPLLRFVLLAAACFVLLPALLARATPTVLQLHPTATVSGRPFPAFSSFTGFQDALRVINDEVAAEGAATLVHSCVPGVTLSPAMLCLSHAQLDFDIQITSDARVSTLGAATTPVCTWKVYGSKAGEYDVSALNAATAGPWSISPAIPLMHVDPALRASSPSSPMRVWPGQWSFNFSRSDGLPFSLSGSLRPIVTCSNLAENPAGNLVHAGDAANGTWEVEFADEGQVLCTFGVWAEEAAADTGRYLPLPDAYFSVGEPARTVLTVGPPAGGFTWSATGNTTNLLTVYPQPQLPAGEWLRLSVTGCSGAADTSLYSGREEAVRPAEEGEGGAQVSPVQHWGAGPSTTGPALVLPPLSLGGLQAQCALQLDGSANALKMYQLESAAVTVDVGRLVQLVTVLDPHSALPSDLTPVVGVSRPNVYFAVDPVAVGEGAHLTVHSLTVAVACAHQCNGDTGAGGPVGSSSVAIPAGSLSAATNLIAMPYWTFDPVSTAADGTAGRVTCSFSVSGTDAAWVLPPPDLVFWVSPPVEFGISGSGGIRSPITSDPESGATLLALPLPSDGVFHLDVAAPGYEVQLELTCTGVAAQWATGGAELTPGVLEWQRDTTAAGRIAITVQLDESLPAPGQTVECAWTVSGRDAALFAPPANVDFFVGAAIQLEATVLPVPGSGLLYARATHEHGTARVNVSAAAGQPFYALGPLGAEFYIRCSVANEQRGGALCPKDGSDPECMDLLVMTRGLSVAPGFNAPLSYPLNNWDAYDENWGAMEHVDSFRVRCDYSLSRDGGAGLYDYRHFLAPATSWITFHTQVPVAVGGSAAHGANLPSNSPASITVLPAQLPLAGEELVIVLECAFAAGTESHAFTYTHSSALAAQAYEFTTASLGEMEGNTVRCSFDVQDTNDKWATPATLQFTVGHVSSFDPVPAALPLMYSSTKSDVFELLPSGCMAGSTSGTSMMLSSSCSPAGVATLEFEESEDASVELTASMQSVAYAIRAELVDAPTAVTCSFELRNDDPSIAFKAPAPVSFEVRPQEGFRVVGARDLAYSAGGELVTLGVQPAAAVGGAGQTVTLWCWSWNRNEEWFADVFFFAGQSSAQYVQFRMGGERGRHQCGVRRQSPYSSPAISDSDRRRWIEEDSSLDVEFHVGHMVHFVLSANVDGVLPSDSEPVGFLRSTCGQPGQVEFKFTPTHALGSGPLSSISHAQFDVECLLLDPAGDGDVQQSRNGGISWTDSEEKRPIYFSDDHCAAEQQAASLLMRAEGYVGRVGCRFLPSVFEIVPPPFVFYVGESRPQAASSGSSGLSTSAKIGIGVGVGVGVPVLLGALVLGFSALLAKRKVAQGDAAGTAAVPAPATVAVSAPLAAEPPATEMASVL